MSTLRGCWVDLTLTVSRMALPAVRSSPWAPFGPWHCELTAHDRLKIGWMLLLYETVGQPGGSHLHPPPPPPPPPPPLPPPAHAAAMNASASRSVGRQINGRARERT